MYSMYYTNTVFGWVSYGFLDLDQGLLGLLGVNFTPLSLSMQVNKSRLLTRATSKTLLIGAEEVRWLRLLLHQHSSAGSVMYGFWDLDRYSGACESHCYLTAC